MKMRKAQWFLVPVFIAAGTLGLYAQQAYQYTLNLNEVKDDQLRVELTPPKVSKKEITFNMPKIIPGTYSNADYGKFIHDFKALDKSGKALAVTRTSDNTWKIKGADKVSKIVYHVEDTWESSIQHDVYDMAGTNIEANKNFVINTPGFFGYYDGMDKVPFEVSITYPQKFYGSSPLNPVSKSGNTDVYRVPTVDDLYDSPMMYCVPDTATIRLGSTSVLISVYSPRKMITSSAVSILLKQMLEATHNYLGGKLPVDKYAFIFYFNGEQPPLTRTGALEHNYSSFYALPELPFENLAPTLLDISAHEFLHIITPLTISSKEVKQFNFQEPVLSRHLWLYEGSTEYQSDHVQVVEGLISPEEFLDKLTEKIKTSRSQYNDSLSFTALSKESAGKYNDQYGNVYEKGALISACLDVYLLQLSNGNYGLRNLKHDLGIKYGKESYFQDDKLFDVITELTYPEIREFFTTYVEGSTPIPYDQFFSWAGVTFKGNKVPSLGGIQLGATPEGNLFIAGTEKMNALGKKLGYKTGDELVSVNGKKISLVDAQEILDNYISTAKEGDDLTVEVNRKNADGKKELVALNGKVMTVDQPKLQLIATPTAQQIKVRNAWLGVKDKAEEPAVAIEAKPEDVNSIDAIVKTIYDVISGPAGERDWNRFRSLFYQGAYMGAIIPVQGGASQFKKFTPEEYIKANGPHFKQFAFYEKELGRKVNQFGNVAQVFSAYEYSMEIPQPVKQRGINSITLVKENNRWYITAITWDEEREGNPIPAEMTTQQPKKKK